MWVDVIDICYGRVLVEVEHLGSAKGREEADAKEKKSERAALLRRNAAGLIGVYFEEEGRGS